jgi:acetyl/propionyl-CoA carboxylase alpha subunit
MAHGMKKVLIANRGEIAIRVQRACAELGIDTVSVYPDDDAAALHVRWAEVSVPLAGVGAAAYLDMVQLVDVAIAQGCDAVHPGYGFLSENADFATLCRARGLAFIGPSSEALALLGDKSRARAHAQACDVPVLPGTQGPSSVDDVVNFHASMGGRPIILKAVAGGGGRGMRVVTHSSEIDTAWHRCRAEALAAFGAQEVYAELLLAPAGRLCAPRRARLHAAASTPEVGGIRSGPFAVARAAQRDACGRVAYGPCLRLPRAGDV